MAHIHSVYFWLNDPAQANIFQQDLEQLLAAADAEHGWTGTPAQTGRSVADDSFTVGATLIFASRAKHDAYQVCAAHDRFVEQWSAAWQRVQVYDTQSPE